MSSSVLTDLHLGVSPFIILYITPITSAVQIFLCVLLSILSLNLHVHTVVYSSQVLQAFLRP
jgi:hypothetical protein